MKNKTDKTTFNQNVWETLGWLQVKDSNSIFGFQLEHTGTLRHCVETYYY